MSHTNRHKLLLKQLSRTGLTQEQCPDDIKKWQQFLDRINYTYQDADQERYLLDRSMEISSREMTELNEKLATAQQIARLGYWGYDEATGNMNWSKELYDLFGLNYSEPAPTIDQLIHLTQEQDKKLIQTFFKEVLREKKESEIEIRMKRLDGSSQYRWFQFISRPIQEGNQFIAPVMGIVIDIQNRKLYEEKVKELNNQLVNSARRAGMADVATAILHNVGNILNSINVSVGLLMEIVQHPYYQKIRAVEQLIQDNLSRLTEYISNDTKGKLIPSYLDNLANDIENNRQIALQELNNLNSKVNHIKDITLAQRSLSGITGIIEEVNLMELIDLAIKMWSNELESHHITVIKHIKENSHLKTDRTKLLQIIVNLVQNAKDALLESQSNDPKKMMIAINQTSKNLMEITISDNGIGISPDNIEKIFSLGFTTKKKGHGFGLHGSAISAIELGGNIKAESPGLQLGAKFILTLPLSSVKKGDPYATER